MTLGLGEIELVIGNINSVAGLQQITKSNSIR